MSGCFICSRAVTFFSGIIRPEKLNCRKAPDYLIGRYLNKARLCRLIFLTRYADKIFSGKERAEFV
jgi:hypothetical protein